jgi:hypothetical protein
MDRARRPIGTAMESQDPIGERRLLLSVARPTAYVPLARAILSRMGFVIVPIEEWREHPGLQRKRPSLLIVDERMLADVPAGADFDRTPIVLLTGKQGVTAADRRIIGATQQPAGLHELYRLIQLALEDNPRRALRVPTNLPARLRGEGREFRGSLLSLSENGCLLRTSEPVGLGSRVEVSFDLPRAGRIELEAEASYQVLPDLGLVFERASARSRRAILDYVEEQLAA